MSTRSVIAEKTADGFAGVYHHFDGYPTGLGEKVWAMVKEHGAQKFVDEYITKHKGGWSSIPETCYCHDKYFVDRDGGEGDMRITEKTVQPLHHEWVYAIDPKTNSMDIYGHGDKPDHNLWVQVLEWSRTKGTKPVEYGLKLIATVKFDEPTPDWDAIERKNY